MCTTHFIIIIIIMKTKILLKWKYIKNKQMIKRWELNKNINKEISNLNANDDF